MKKQYLFYPLFLGIFLALGILIGHVLSQGDAPVAFSGSTSLKKRKLNRLIDLIDQRYVDQVNTDSIVDLTVNGILQNLDPHSVYISTSDAQAVADDMRGNFVGIGIRYFVVADTISVLSTVRGGPSENAGIKSGDRILSVDGKPLYGENKVSTEELKGKKGTRVVLGVLRPGDKKIVEVPVTRERIALESVEAAYKLTDKLGYIKVNRFAESTTTEFRQAIKKLKKQGVEEIAIDLRDNPGGVLQAAIDMADEFLKADQLILFQKDRENERKYSYATDDGDFEDKKVYILINENSASASEVVAGALQDNDKGTIIGRRSFGKGLVQQELQLGDGSAVRLTVARYYTPTGRSIQRPYENGNQDYFEDYLDRYANGELLDADAIEVNDSLKYTTPGGKIVYGGGGIIPDVFVPGAEGYGEQMLQFFAQSGYADRLVNEFLRGEGSSLRTMTQQDFVENYKVEEKLLLDFYQLARTHDNSLRLTGNRDFMTTLLKASIAEQLYGTELKVKLLNTQDKVIDRLLELSRNAN